MRLEASASNRNHKQTPQARAFESRNSQPSEKYEALLSGPLPGSPPKPRSGRPGLSRHGPELRALCGEAQESEGPGRQEPDGPSAWPNWPGLLWLREGSFEGDRGASINRGPQNRPKYIMVLTIGATKMGPLIFGNSHIDIDVEL